MLRHRDNEHFLLHGFVVMPDHLHILLTPAESIEKTAQLIKGGFSFAIRKQFTGEVWQTGYFAHRAIDHEDYKAQLVYIANNPLGKGYLDDLYVHTTGAWPLDQAPASHGTAPPGPNPGD